MKKFKDLWTIEVSKLTKEDIEKYAEQWENENEIKDEIQNCIKIVSDMWL